MVMVLLLALSAGTGQADRPVRTVDRVDLDRYLGEWFEVARFPNDFQRHCARDVRARYTKRGDGRIDVTNTCTTSEGEVDEARGVAKAADEQTSAKLKVRFAPAVLSWLPFVWGDYWILGLGPDYSWAVVGSPDRKYLWVLSRMPALDANAYQNAAAVARENGFDDTRLVRTNQSPAGRTRHDAEVARNGSPAEVCIRDPSRCSHRYALGHSSLRPASAARRRSNCHCITLDGLQTLPH